MPTRKPELLELPQRTGGRDARQHLLQISGVLGAVARRVQEPVDELEDVVLGDLVLAQRFSVQLEDVVGDVVNAAVAPLIDVSVLRR
ncbi:Uncharacterised protein [Mycobacteroides abscessus subsp. massiliense]|nr:Uncharacterised protein [Mycobacteroides abscessus subsp. massiliense]